MARPLALRTKILRRLYDSRSKIHLPVAIHSHPRQKRMIRTGQPLRQSQIDSPALSPVDAAPLAPRPSHTSPFLRKSPRISMCVSPRLGHVLHHHRLRNFPRPAPPPPTSSAPPSPPSTSQTPARRSRDSISAIPPSRPGSAARQSSPRSARHSPAARTRHQPDLK